MCIKFDIKILLFLAMFYITNQHKMYLLFLAFIFLHEIAHLIVGIILGVIPTHFEIKPIGCSISFRYKIDDYNKKILKGNLAELKKIIIYLAGPLFNFIVGIIALLLCFNESICYINFSIMIFNLLFIYPLDGGRIFKSILSIFLGEGSAYKCVKKTTNVIFILLLVVCSVVILEYHNMGIICGLIYVQYIRIRSNKEIDNKLRIIELINQ